MGNRSTFAVLASADVQNDQLVLKRLSDVLGIPYETIYAMKRYKMVKINIASDLRRAFIGAVGKAYDANPGEANLAKVLLSARAAVTEVAYTTTLAINGMADVKVAA